MTPTEAVMPEEPERFTFEGSGLFKVGGMPSAALDYIRYRDFLVWKLHAQQSAEAARVAREEVDAVLAGQIAAEQGGADIPKYFTETGRRNWLIGHHKTERLKAESRLREVEARTVERKVVMPAEPEVVKLLRRQNMVAPPVHDHVLRYIDNLRETLLPFVERRNGIASKSMWDRHERRALPAQHGEGK